MKYRIVSLIAVFFILSVAGCSSSKSNPTADTSVTTEEKTTEAETTNPPVDTAAFFKEIAGDYTANLATKGGTAITISDNGNFTGEYYYYSTAVGDTEATKGKMERSRFNGSFQNVQKVDEFTYSLDVSSLDYITPVGVETIENDARMKNSISPHIISNNQFYLFLPNTPSYEIPDDGLTFLNYTIYNGSEEKYDRYILYNRSNGIAFHSISKVTNNMEN